MDYISSPSLRDVEVETQGRNRKAGLRGKLLAGLLTPSSCLIGF